MTNQPLDVLIIGGGMITNDQLLPSIYHLQRLGVVNEISICALNSAPLQALQRLVPAPPRSRDNPRLSR